MWFVQPRLFPESVRAGFTGATKPPGFGAQRFSFELQGPTEPEDSRMSRRWLLDHCELPETAWRDVEQVHGSTCLEQDGSTAWKHEKADALWTRSQGLLLTIRTADCVPVLVTSKDEPLAVAIHAGWRGTHSQIVSKSLKEILESSGVRASSLIAAIGPAIHSRAFEVDADVADPFRAVYGDEIVCPTPGRARRWNVDLIEANRRELLEVGLLAEHIEIISTCTFEDHNFWSHRRQRSEAGRQVAWITL